MNLQAPAPTFISQSLHLDLHDIISTEEQLLDAQLVVNRTFLIKAGRKHPETYSLIHVSSDNNILWKIYFSAKQKYLVMEDTHFLITNRSKNELEIYSLEKRTVTLIEHYFQPSYQSQKMVVNYFHKGKVFCLSQSTSDFSTLLTYFSYHDLTVSAKPIHRIQIKDVLIHRETQLNDISRLGWACSHSTNCNTFKIFSIKQDVKGHVLEQSIDISVDPKESTQYQQINFGNGVYKRKLCFSLVLQINKNEFLLKADELFGTRYFVLDISEGHQQGIITHLHLKYQDHYFDLSDYLIVESFYHHFVVFRNKTNQTLVFADLVTKEVEEVLKVWDRTESTIMKFIGGRYLMDFFEEQHGGAHLAVLDWVVRLKEHYLHLLLGYNQDFECQLLSDCLELLS